MNISVKITREENARHFNMPVGSVITMDIEAYLRGVVPAEVGNAP